MRHKVVAVKWLGNKTVGFLVEKTDKYITVARTLKGDTAEGTLRIPWSVIDEAICGDGILSDENHRGGGLRMKTPCDGSLYAGPWCLDCPLWPCDGDDRKRAAHLDMDYEAFVARKAELLRQAKETNDTDKPAAA